MNALEWAQIVVYFGGRCAYCLRKTNELTRDHVRPRSRGGSDDADNIVPACGRCNSRKSNLHMFVMLGYTPRKRRVSLHDDLAPIAIGSDRTCRLHVRDNFVIDPPVSVERPADSSGGSMIINVDGSPTRVALREQYIKCGKRDCGVCVSGGAHGPYWYGFYTGANGRLKSKYIGKVRPTGSEDSPSRSKASAPAALRP